MRRSAMSIALLAAIILCDAADVSVPRLSMTGGPVRVLASAMASVPPWRAVFPRINLPMVLPGRRPARPSGYAIPADHPRPPLGRFKLTAYSGPQQGKARAITATGTSARAGRTVAVDPKVIPLGSRIYIEGIGERIAEDVGGAIKGRHIDLYVPSVPEANRFGVQRRIVTVVATVDPS
jgi:3D (Asp-Asp-Asp) domain-containing protein